MIVSRAGPKHHDHPFGPSRVPWTRGSAARLVGQLPAMRTSIARRRSSSTRPRLALLDEAGDLGAHFIDVADLGPQLLDFCAIPDRRPLQLFQTLDPFLPEVEELLALQHPGRDIFRTAGGSQ